jgi:hypothetical protein
MTDNEESRKINATQMGMHAYRNFLGNPKQLNLFSDHPTKFGHEYGVQIDETIDRVGMDLTDIQMRVMEGILRGFSETNYKGNIPPEDKQEIAQSKYSGKLPSSYKYVREIPRLRVTQKQILEWSGLNTGNWGDKQRAIEALAHLGAKQYWYHYDRLVFDEKGCPEKDKNGDWKKEAIDAVDTLITVKTVREKIPLKQQEKNTKIQGEVKYYEITPSAVFLDQRESYFILFPYNWRDEIDALYHKKKYSAYIPKFIYFLRLQYELKRRAKNEKPYQLRWSTEEIAIALNMPKSFYKGQKERTNKLIEEALMVAKKLGYLQKYERTDAVEVLTFEDSKYSIANSPAHEKTIGAISGAASPTQLLLFDFFHKKKIEFNEYHTTPTGAEKEEQLKEFNLLLNQKKPEDIQTLIKWGLSQKFWCDRLSTPRKLRDNFDAAWTEMNAVKQSRPTDNPQENKSIGEALKSLMSARRPDIEVLLEPAYLEFRNGVHVVNIEYNDLKFKRKIELFLQKINIPFEELTSHLT